MGEIIKFEQVIESYISGDWGNDVSSDEAPCPVSCIRGADIIPIRNSDFANIPIRYISSRSLAAHTLQEGDIVIEKSGGSPTQSTGRVVYISKELLAAKGDVVCSNFCVAFRVKAEWNPKYIYYYLCNIYNADVFFNFEGKTSGLKNLQVEAAFKAIPIKKNAIEEQTSIANTLSIIESKLAVNRQINDNLEAMAKQLYDYWFVQFDFPNEEGKPYKSSGGKMVWNEKLKREIPEGWEILTIKDVCSRIQSGGTPLTSVEEYYNGDISWYRTQELCDKWLFESSIKISEEAVENSSAKWFDANTVVIAIYASPTCGRLGLLANGGTFNQACCGLIPSEKCSKEYLFMWLKENRAKLNTLASGTAQKNLNVDKVKNFEILMPENRNIRLWTKTVETIFGALKSYSFEMEQLTKQRDELLPLLMNGQVSVNYHLSDD